ncbi:MAG: tetraacyldisaccharide 4'-kinase [Xanthobacteraceae bacterium]|nr:tetraacyldisaccharide 4'-kinase [Xanthobacteraceae bacterium]
MTSLRAPEFWWRKAGVAAAALYPAGAIYGAVASARMKGRGYRAKIPVICVGNPTLGGAGKTPTALAIGNWLKREGKKVFFLTRGYGGNETGPLLADPVKYGARSIGDEAPLLAGVAPTIVAHDRAAGAKLAEDSGADVLVMDDGFQNPSLEKDFSFLVIDGAKGVGNGLVFPAGPLRAPLSPQLKRAQAMIVVGDGEASEKAARFAREHGLPVFRGKLVPDPASAAELKSRRVLAFAGIGAPEKFFHSLEAAGAVVAAWKSFGDHHRFSESDAAELLAKAEAGGLDLVTTEKDLARMNGDEKLAVLRERSKVLRVRLALDDENGAFAAIKNSLKL